MYKLNNIIVYRIGFRSQKSTSTTPKPLKKICALSQRRICSPPPHPIRSSHMYIKDAKCSETNEKSFSKIFSYGFIVAKRKPFDYKKYVFKSSQIYRKDEG